MSQPGAPCKRRHIRDDGHEEAHKHRMELIYHESPFNFIKMHLLSPFSYRIRQFGNIAMYSIELGELAHK